MAKIVTLTMNPALDIATSTDQIVPEHKLRCDTPRYDPGGGGINVARAVHALGVEALAVFPAGGAAGRSIGQLLQHEGVGYAAVPIAGFTRESLNVVERTSGMQYRFVLPGPAVGALDQQRCLDELAGAAADAHFIVASGSLPQGVAEDFYGRVVALARDQGKPLVLDTSGPALRRAGAGVYLLKPSLVELESLVGRPLRGEREEEQAARELIEHERCEIALISLGARGAILASRDAIERLPSIPVAVKSAVGAGDSMLAGMLVGLTRGLSLREAACFGIAAGAAALLAPGTQLCRLDDVERFYRQCPAIR
ncbi:MAG: 1-phosphofructokinase family hexose kinase [Pseudomonadota bacterium]|nr:1-phosphofructokinase family hexose kinase [Xanthomonadaceae bacterium]MDE2247164.1 1-phosphofructokinase family hexose kinase [Xanthomonadaceae bacterium]MDE3210317.1 1-phosphofructokinase family hexose kinase [Pseudomonadota bacterium]